VTRQQFLAKRIETIRNLISGEFPAVSSDRAKAASIDILAVTKAASDEDFLAMASLNLPLAENRWDQLVSRMLMARNSSLDPSFHFIGALQRRSTKEKGIPVSLISTVDREGILPVLDHMALSHAVRNPGEKRRFRGIPSGASRCDLKNRISPSPGNPCHGRATVAVGRFGGNAPDL